MGQRLPTFFLGLVAITPFLIISITAYTSEKFPNGLHDTQGISSLSVNQLREDDKQEILPKSNSFA